jgi:hypothetical protein
MPKSHSARVQTRFELPSPTVALRQVVLVLTALGVSFAACTRVEVEGPAPPLSLNEGGAAGQSSGGLGPVEAGRGSGGDEGPPASGGEPGSLELGIWPTFVTDPSRSRDVQAVSASVSALSAGSAALPVVERWDALSGASGTPLSATWNRLDAMIEPYRERRAKVALCIGVVDRSERAWPFAGDLDAEGASSVMERTVDDLFSRYGGSLSHLCFGYELDRYWASSSAKDWQRLRTFLKQAVDYASAHPLRSAATAIGVAVSMNALLPESDVPLEDLSVGDELLGVYDPLTEDGELKDPGDVGEELSAALETASRLPRPMPLGLMEVGYPSDEELGASERAQLAYYESLFAALDERRGELSFVGFFGLGDRAAAECESEAEVFGGDTERRALARCSTGLRAGVSAGADKAAWEPVLAAMARYR